MRERLCLCLPVWRKTRFGGPDVRGAEEDKNTAPSIAFSQLTPLV